MATSNADEITQTFDAQHREAHAEDPSYAPYAYVDQRVEGLDDRITRLYDRIAELERELGYKADERHSHREYAEERHSH